jgi:hypothetical protein
VFAPSLCQSQFCEGVNVSNFGHYDLVPNVTWAAAHAAIATVAADFLTLVTNFSSTASASAARSFASHFAYTDGLVKGFLATRTFEGASDVSTNWCAGLQTATIAPGSVSRVYNMSVDVVSHAASLSVKHPSIAGSPGSVSVSLVSYAAYALNPIDVSTVPVAATSLTCEMMSADAVDVQVSA